MIKSLQYKSILGGFLAQTVDNFTLEVNKLNTVTKKTMSDATLTDLLFAWKVAKHVKSNAIVVAKNKTTIGIGHGQVSRIDAVEIALKKSFEKSEGAVLASDAFFPFRDSIDMLKEKGISAVIQPGGSIRDKEVIAACDENAIAMVFTGIRAFNH